MASFFDINPFRAGRRSPFTMPKHSRKKGRSFKKRAFPVRRRTLKPTAFRRGSFKGAKRRKTTTSVKTLAKRVTKLKKSVDTGLAVLTHRKLTLGTLSTIVGKQLTQSVVIQNQGAINDKLSAVSYFDSSTNTIVVIDASDSSTTYQRDYKFNYQGVKVKLTNTYTTPLTLDARLVRPKNDTSVTAISAYTAGLIDIGSPDASGLLTKISDSQVYNDLYTDIVRKKAVLQPGESLVLMTNLGPMDYQIQTAEADALQFRVANKPCQLMVRLQGPVGRDSVNLTELSYLPATVQYEIEAISKIEYQAGLSIRRVVLEEVNIQPSFANAGTVSAKPVAAQQTMTSGVF